MIRKLLSLTVAMAASLYGIYSVAEEDVPAASDIGVLGVGINVSDLARSEKFYTEVFGLVRTFRFPPEGNLQEVGLARPGEGMNIILAHFNDDPVPAGSTSYGRIVFSTADAKAVAALASERGSTIRNVGTPGPTNPVIIFFDDPDGYQIEVYNAPPSQ